MSRHLVEREAAAPERRRITRFREWPKQAQYAAAVASGQYRYLAYGGAIRGGKSYATLNTIQALALIFPRSRWAICRQDLPTMRRNTIPTFEKIKLTNFVGDLNKSTWTYPCSNGSEIMIFPESYQFDPEYTRWAGLEVNGILLEEANELQEQTFTKSRERCGAWIVPPTDDQQWAIDEEVENLTSDGIEFAEAYRLAARRCGPLQPPPLILLTFNPADNWVRERFYDPWEQGRLAAPYYFLPATVKDNPALNQEYLDSLEEMKIDEPEAYNRFVLGIWGTLTHPKQLIQMPWILNAREVDREGDIPRAGLDVARYGSNHTVEARAIGNDLVDLRGWRKQSTALTSQIAARTIVEHGIPHDYYVVDTVGIGGGVADNLVDAGFNVIGFEAGMVNGFPRPDSFYKFKNLRSQAWWEFREKLRRGEIRISIPIGTEPWKRLVKELTSMHFEVAGDRTIMVDSKDNPKLIERLGGQGRSTDYADAVIQCFFDFPEEQAQSALPPSMGQATY